MGLQGWGVGVGGLGGLGLGGGVGGIEGVGVRKVGVRGL